MLSDMYKLDGKKVVKCNNTLEWGKAFETQNRIVGKTEKNDIMVSTVFIGLDHQFGTGKPLLFETMVFNGEFDQETVRYSTWEEAEAGHREMCKKVFGE